MTTTTNTILIRGRLGGNQSSGYRFTHPENLLTDDVATTHYTVLTHHHDLKVGAPTTRGRLTSRSSVDPEVGGKSDVTNTEIPRTYSTLF